MVIDLPFFQHVAERDFLLQVEYVSDMAEIIIYIIASMKTIQPTEVQVPRHVV